MKKITMLVLLVSILFSQACATKVRRTAGGDIEVNTRDPKVSRSVANPDSDYTPQLDRACAEMVRQGKASYIRTERGTECIVHDPNQPQSPLGQMKHGAFENVGDREIIIEVRNSLGLVMSSFTLGPANTTRGIYYFPLPVGYYTYSAYYNGSPTTLGSDFPVNERSCPDCHTGSGVKVEWRVVVK